MTYREFKKVERGFLWWNGYSMTEAEFQTAEGGSTWRERVQVGENVTVRQKKDSQLSSGITILANFLN